MRACRLAGAISRMSNVSVPTYPVAALYKRTGPRTFLSLHFARTLSLEKLGKCSLTSIVAVPGSGSLVIVLSERK